MRSNVNRIWPQYQKIQEHQKALGQSRAVGLADPCSKKLTVVDAFLYGLPAGFFLALLLFLCFIFFGKAIISRRDRNPTEVSASSMTAGAKELLGKRKKRGPPPSSQLKPVDVMALASHESAPDDIRQTLALSKGTNKEAKESRSK